MDADLRSSPHTGRVQELEALVASPIMPYIKPLIYKAIRNAFISILEDGPVGTPRTMVELSMSISHTIEGRNGEHVSLTTVLAVHTMLAPIITATDTRGDKS